MAKLLKVEGTDICLQIDNCDACPLRRYGDDEWCEKDECELTNEVYDPKWVLNDNGRGYHPVHYIMSKCPLPDKPVIP